ncbi:hypothetical protein NQ317_009286 [Molorchus minor]|uniref:Uncharacterized protein n=1 Tax=Molorchus minor TaxID=1323400 RepID=A0ABQ9JDH0_9CUCU|nr:hypothetical protein NQ317_009286 [Molorchus minor]
MNIIITIADSYPGYYSPLSLEGQNPEYLLQTIARLRQALINDDDLERTKKIQLDTYIERNDKALLLPIDI